MKKWGFFLLCLSLVFTIKESYFQDKAEVQRYEENNKEYLDDSETSESFQTIKITKEMVFQGNLLLVNNEYPVLEESIKTDVVNLFKHDELTKGYELLNREIYLSEKVAREFSEMVDAAEKKEFAIFQSIVGFETLMSKMPFIKKWGLTTPCLQVIANII